MGFYSLQNNIWENNSFFKTNFFPILINIFIFAGVVEAFTIGRESEIGSVLKMFVITQSKLLAAVVSSSIQILASWCVEVDEEPKVLVAYDWGNQQL